MKALSVGPQHKNMKPGVDFHSDPNDGIVFHIRHCVVCKSPEPEDFSIRPSKRTLRMRKNKHITSK